MIRVTGWEQAIANLGTAYTMAAKSHTDAVEAKKKIDAIHSQVMFSVLTVASAGTLAWISGAAQAAKGASDEASLLTNVLEDVLQNSAAEVLSANGPGLHQRVPTPAQSAVSMEPLAFQNERLVRLKGSQQQAHILFKSITDGFLKASDADWDKYDEAKQTASYSSWLAKADLLNAGPALPPVADMARELERGFWAKWAPALRSSYIPSAERITGRNKADISYVTLTTPVEARLDALGITKESGVGDFGYWTTDAEIQQFIDWAAGYQVKPFL